jgi:hypothetical protein
MSGCWLLFVPAAVVLAVLVVVTALAHWLKDRRDE